LGSYQTSPDGYASLRERAGTGAIAPRGQIAVAGRDRASYLQGLLTNDVQSLAPGTGCYSAWLTPQGRMLTDLHVFESGDMLLLDVPAAELAPTLARLDQFLFSEDVQLADMSASLRGVWVHGPDAPAIVARTLSGVDDLAAWTGYRNARATFADEPVVVARVDQLGVPGFCLYVAPPEEDALRGALAAAGAPPASPEALEAARIEAGYPVFGIDMTTDTIPLEAGIEQRAISFTKGCYVGQEVIIRVLHRGQGRVARKLVTLRIDGDEPKRGAKLIAGEKEVGAVTSAARSPRDGVLALGYVHRDFVAPGSALVVDLPPRGGSHAGDGTHPSRATATVIERPIPSAA
jgi:tRNA-modifying protein YgfZ